MQHNMTTQDRLMNPTDNQFRSLGRFTGRILAILTCVLHSLPASAHIITNPSLPKPAIEATVELDWPTELDKHTSRVDPAQFSATLAMARFANRPTVQFNVLELESNGSSQPFFTGAPFGEGGLIGFRFVDFGPFGQEFTGTAWREDQLSEQAEQYNGFAGLPGDLAGFNRFGRSGKGTSSNGDASSQTAGNQSSSSAGGDGLNLNQGAYNPFANQNLYGQASFGSGGGGGSDSGGGFNGSNSGLDAWMVAVLLRGPLGPFERGIFDGGITILDLGPLDPFGWPWGFGRPGIGLPGLFPFTPPLYSCWDPCGPGIHTPILGFPFGIFNPILGPIGPIGFPFPHWHHHHCCPHPPCVPEPSQFALLATLVPGLGLMFRLRRRTSVKNRK